MTLKTILAALGIAAIVAASVPVAAQAEGMHSNMKRQMRMSHMHHRMHHRMMRHHMMRHHMMRHHMYRM